MFFNKLNAFFALSFILCLACVTQAKPVQIVAITEDFASIAKSIGGELVSTKALIKGSKNLHHINPKPSMVMALRSADILIRLGMEQDSWVDSLILTARNKALYPGQKGYIDASVGINKLEVPNEKIDGSQGDVHRFGNPHYWLNPDNGIVIAATIRDTLKRIDPANASSYEANFIKFKSQIQKALVQWRAQMKGFQSQHFVSYHKVWAYFYEAFRLTTMGELEVFPGIQPTVRHLADLKERALANKEPITVIVASYYPTHSAQKFANSVNANFVTLPTNVGEAGISSYTELFDHIIKELNR